MKRLLPYLCWSFCATLWTMVCFIMPDFIDNPIDSFQAFVYVTGYILALGGTSFFLLYLAGLNRYLAVVLYPLFAILGAVVSYFRVAFHATITPMVIEVTLHTNVGEVASVFGWQLIFWLLINGLIVACLLWWRWRLLVPRPWLQALTVVLLWMPCYFGSFRMHTSARQRYPYNIVYNFIEYIKQQQDLQEERIVLPTRAVAVPDSLDVIVVLGEAMRADHLELNGYERQTTPRLNQRTNIVSLPHIYSPYTHTLRSVPYILSPADSLHPDWVTSHCSFICILKQYGFHSSWISNQDNGRTYAVFIHEADTVVFANASKSTYVYDPWYDEELLPYVDEQIQLPEARRLIVLHTIGSHWYYSNHVPEQYQIYRPQTANRAITANTPEQVINSYDNTALYMDAVMDSLIQRFETRCAIVIYLSDHGEALGENGVWLHAAEVEPLHQPACFVWFSDRYKERFDNKIEALHTNKDKRYNTEFLFYSVLSAAGVEPDSTVSQLNIFE